jgi:hypothetical protein
MAGVFGTDPADMLESELILAGTTTQIEETLQQRREELGFSYIIVGEEGIDALAPVVARLAGT